MIELLPLFVISIGITGLVYVLYRTLGERDSLRYQLGVKDTIIVDYENRLGNLMRDNREHLECTASQIEEKNQELQFLTIRAHLAEEDADRMAKTVRELVNQAESFAKTIADEPPPLMRAERDALQLHDNAVKLRTQKTNGPTDKDAAGNG